MGVLQSSLPTKAAVSKVKSQITPVGVILVPSQTGALPSHPPSARHALVFRPIE